ncbi:carboxypeptidase-like regulatory domain-containing protein [Tautonia sociabilis]|uniref:Carboxypeptidase regulatory-like domain-containing protein n=1 Tax=Tautonia sociabilis TaxID=2080755 RepID=A0A432MLZ0_9BACT|nr:carboxypeptidase-like regulatory domain-containing protein [Tautonia sociabilis]RUL88217.1 carboxypeptidase regulatory-like domain-containing protein [Tautonia sociabilis]
MSLTIRRLASGGLLALVLSLPPTPAAANGFGLLDGLFGPRATVYDVPVETIFAVPTVTSYVVPTTEVISTSYLVPTSTVVYRPARYTLAPTIYRPATTVLPTRYYVGGTLLRPTRYYLDDVVTTTYYSDPIVYPSRIVYDTPVIESSAPVVIDAPAASPSPSATRSQSEPRLSNPPRQSTNPPGSGRSSALESRPEPEPAAPEAAAAPPEPQPIDQEPTSPPDVPALGEDGSIEGILPLPEPFEMRQSQRPAFGGVPGSSLASATKLVQGRVRDERTGQPRSGLVVTFSNTVSSFAERRAVTDDRGQFQLEEFLPDGDWSIVVSGQAENEPTRTYPQVTVVGGRIYDRLGRDYTKLVLDY